MNSVKVLHCADIHIGAAESFLGENAAKRRFETLLTFEKIIKEAKNNQVDFILISGDLFDNNKIESEFFDRTFNTFASVPEIKIVYAAGNHDPLNELSPFKNRTLPENLYVLGIEDECLRFSDKGVRVYGRSFADTSMQGKSRFSITPPDDDIINIMVLHGELKSDLNSQYNAITSDFVKNSAMDYIALGHVHTRSDVLRLNSTYFAYCGCPEGQGFDETDEKGVYIGEIAKGECKLNFMPISKRQHIACNFDVSQCENSADISEKVIVFLKENYGDDFAANLYKITVIGEIEEDFRIDLAEISSRISNCVYFAKVKDKTSFKIDTESLSREKNLKGIFVRNMLEKIENTEDESQKALYKDALNLGLKAFLGEVSFDED